jgi:transcriptional regulator with XRE-family HTH domain
MAKRVPDPVDKQVGARVRMRRMMIGMSQEKLAEALGLSFQQVQKYEKGSNRIAPSRLAVIAKTLDVPVTFFFEGTGAKSGSGKDPLITQLLSSRDGLQLGESFLKIRDKTVRRRLVDLAQSLAG